MGDSREKVETAEFYLSAPRYLRQAHESEPHLVNASPSAPIKVVLPAKIERGGAVVDQPEDKFLTRVKGEKPKVPHPGVKSDKVKPAHEAIDAKGGRAADK